MAKKKSGKKAAKLPKKIAGVKVPKQLRGPGGRLLEAVNNPLLIDAAAAALAAAAARLAERADPSARAPALQARAGAPKAESRPGGELGAILSTLALEGLRRAGETRSRSVDRAPRD